VYGREYDGQELTFEASGGLINASLVMQDRETDSYWSIMTDEAVAGPQKGVKLEKIYTGKKAMWLDWRIEHPNTLVLSVDGKEDAPFGYSRYFSSEEGFRGISAKDNRLADKESIFTFHLSGSKYAIPFSLVEGGKTFAIDDENIFIFRPVGAAIFYSTVAYRSQDRQFVFDDGLWKIEGTACIFDRDLGAFAQDATDCAPILEGFDTFWYIWSLTNPETKLIAE
jgi:hypothetical protein